jgi:hypothetical protein
VVPTQCQGTFLGERGVTRSRPSGTRPGEENSTGTLPKLRKWETSEGGRSRIRGGENGVLKKGDGGLPGSTLENSSSGAFPFLSTTSGLDSGVARGSCG